MMKLVAYHFRANNNLRALELAREELASAKDEMNNIIEEAKRQHGVPTQEAKEWLDEVNTVVEEVEAISEGFRQRPQCMCLSKYKVSQVAERKLNEMKSLLARRAEFEVIEFQASHNVPRAVTGPTNFEMVMNFVKDGMQGVLGLWGVGGVGKTHLLKQVHSSLACDPSFDAVIFVTCSKECSEERIQNEIVERFRLPRSSNLQSQAKIINNFLKEKSFAFLIDDIWGRLDLDLVGLPSCIGMDNPSQWKRKIILTTRSEEVCGAMEVGSKIKVECLKGEKALFLFEEKVGDETMQAHPLIPILAEEMVKELGGLPLALIVTGRAMRDKKDPREWYYAIKLLKKWHLNDIESSGTNESILRLLKFSYENLNNSYLKECFLYCALWPEDREIKKRELIYCWIGLGLIDELDMKDALSIGYNYISKLEVANLLEPTESHDEVKLHDVIREMLLWIACEEGKNKYKWFVQAGVRLKAITQNTEIWSTGEIISLMNNEIDAFSPPTDNHSKPSVLMLQRNLLKSEPELGNFKGIKYLDLSWCNLSNFPMGICELTNLQFLNLSGNKFTSLPMGMILLKKLQFLLLRGTAITKIPKGLLSQLKELRVLDLYNFWKRFHTVEYLPSLLNELECLSKFSSLGINIYQEDQLQKLNYLTQVPIASLKIFMLSAPGSFSLLSNFHGPNNVQENLNELFFHKCSFESIEMERNSENPNWHFENLETMLLSEMMYLKPILWKGVTPKDMLPRLRSLSIDYCKSLHSISWIVYLPCLEDLSIIRCKTIEQLVSADEVISGEIAESVPPFPSLVRILLWYLPNLQNICSSTYTFPSLQHIYIIGCPELKKLPFKKQSMPPKLRSVVAEVEWWRGVQWEDESLKSSFQPFFKRP
ncbi:Disease resistance protein RPS5 [Rhynchospora pubera]|uniref:Disease resistance protein RPS5 n=1 Tax=Rhynchospora pubera TaxID=906938 RepID=A0AAV8GWV2_9POAL|nr:Disease resistance protein RPS5 [Rhynchospora pubera]